MSRLLPDPLRPDLKDRVIFVTGGTGSFGRAFVTRLLAEYEPKKVIVFSRDEQKHYVMQREMPDPRLRFFVGDVRDQARLMRALSGVDIVVHAAAMKHVPIAEYNPLEAIKTNIDGATHIIDAAVERGVEHVVALSTDKAVNPVNLYGATKLCMEKLLVAANSYTTDGKTRFDLVRYGNVVGSKGSVVPVFLKQREQGELTLTEPSMTRFWIVMEEAIDLVLLALRTGLGGETFIPKLPACTVDVLARAIAPGAEHKILGVRPGEKIHEALITVDEAQNVVEYESHYVICPSYPWWGGPERTGGTKMTSGFSYSSENARHLGVEEVQALLSEAGFIA